MYTWVGHEGAVFRQPPSRLALDPADVVTFDHDDSTVPLNLVALFSASEATGTGNARLSRQSIPRPARP